VAGNDCVATVVKVGPGVKNVSEDDWVLPYKPGMGTWRALAVWREKDVIKLPKDIMPIQFAAMTRACPAGQQDACCAQRALMLLRHL
jgi:trans-2-enoyl-CoA reductase